MINTHLKKLKTIFLKIFYNKTLLSFIFMSLGMMYLFFSISLTIQCYKNLNIDLNICLSFLIYNTLFSFYTIKLIKDLSDRNIFNIIIQYNNSLISKNQHNLQTQNNVLKIETLSLKNTSLKNHNNEIENISFSINRKNHLAILSNDVCISLIREFFENYNIKKSGTILINDSEIEHINPDILKQSIITISTNITIKNNETLKYNLLLDNTNISDDILIKASKLSYLYDYIISNQFGYYAIINEESNFSELEKFQISLTRALLSDGHIIIVDFTGIDEENITIKNIKEMLITSLIDRILIIITKDTYKLEEMDKILFYNKNNFQTYIGNHKDLIKKSNEYNNFYLQNYKDIKFTE